MTPASTRRLAIKGAALLKRSGETNANQLAHKLRVAAQTAYKYVHTPEELTSIDCKVLAAILLDGFGLTEKQALDVRLGELFEFIDDKH
ncbi:MAG TPA: hypothetical protein VIV15_04115 [Anaerolineales bacterium]